MQAQARGYTSSQYNTWGPSANKPILQIYDSSQMNFRTGKRATTRWVIITGPPSFQRHNFVNMRYIYTKISTPKHEIMLHEMLLKLPTTCTLFGLMNNFKSLPAFIVDFHWSICHSFMWSSWFLSSSVLHDMVLVNLKVWWEIFTAFDVA